MVNSSNLSLVLKVPFPRGNEWSGGDNLASGINSTNKREEFIGNSIFGRVGHDVITAQRAVKSNRVQWSHEIYRVG